MVDPKRASSWRGWRGGDCPVSPEQIVEVRFRDGTMSLPVAAGELDWTRYDDGADVVRYRAAPPMQRTTS